MKSNIIYIHGLISSGHGFKGNFFRKVIPNCLTPDLEEYNKRIPRKILLKKRMHQLNNILMEKKELNIIGSSFGGLIATLYTSEHPKKVRKLILLAPFLIEDDLIPPDIKSINIPVIIFHGKNDKVIPLEQNRIKANFLFKNFEYNVVLDDHQLQHTVKTIDWLEILELN
ncbi:MAG: alpha/beta fold hydrolase [Candidatus Lokiarchaeota archaeon]|nr:alpha/beta fold hydrolase [Candidatus Lokiarchaeota archaeon]